MNDKMRWFWRLLTLLVCLGICKTLFAPEPREFIAWPAEQTWLETIQGELRYWQRISQDLPASIEVEVRQLWKDFQPGGGGEKV